jgi:peptidoglycan/LPS O-acetylase OafA/YrhL
MPKSVDRINGFDWLRVLALGLVLVFHISGLLDMENGCQIAA